MFCSSAHRLPSPGAVFFPLSLTTTTSSSTLPFPRAHQSLPNRCRPPLLFWPQSLRFISSPFSWRPRGEKGWPARGASRGGRGESLPARHTSIRARPSSGAIQAAGESEEARGEERSRRGELPTGKKRTKTAARASRRASFVLSALPRPRRAGSANLLVAAGPLAGARRRCVRRGRAIVPRARDVSYGRCACGG